MTGIKQYLYEQRFSLAKIVCGVACIGVLYALYLGFSYSRPMMQERFQDASQSWVADKAVALYDAGLQQYKEEQYAASIKTLTEALNACQTAEGGIKADKRLLAADIKFVHANALYKSGKMKTAKQLYEDCLRLDPDNMAAKNNLEILNSMNGGKGPQDDSPGGASPNGGPKKGI